MNGANQTIDVTRLEPGHGSPSHRASGSVNTAESGRVSGQSFICPDPVLWPGSRQNNRLIHCTAVSFVRPLGPSIIVSGANCIPVGPASVSAHLLRHAAVFKHPPHLPSSTWNKCAIFKAYVTRTFTYNRSCCTFACKARVANLKWLRKYVRGPNFGVLP